MEDNSQEKSPEKSMERLAHGKEALNAGDLPKAIKDFSASIRFGPNPEAYFLKAEAYYLRHDLSGAFEALERLEGLSQKLPNKDAWSDLIAQSRARYDRPDKSTRHEPLEPITAILPVHQVDAQTLAALIMSNPQLSFDGTTLFNKAGTCSYSVTFLPKSDALAKTIISWRDQNPFGGAIEQSIRSHTMFLRIETLTQPNHFSSKIADNQMLMAIDFLQMLNVLMDFVKAPVAYLRKSTLVHSQQEVATICQNLSASVLVDTYATSFHENGYLFSIGMKFLGFCDVQIRDGVVSNRSAPDLLFEFMVYQLINETSVYAGDIRFDSSATRTTYDVVHEHGDRYPIFDEHENLSENPLGVWSIEKVPEITPPDEESQVTSKSHMFL